MKVLYVLGQYPKISESYIAAEIDFMRRSGVEIEVWAAGIGTPGMKEAVPVHRGSVKDAIRAFKPDLVHVHYLFMCNREVEAAASRITVRGHSFDHSPGEVRRVLSVSHARRIYLFPHFAEPFKGDGRVMVMPVAYNPALFFPDKLKDRSLVLRTSAAKPGKGLEDFVAVAALCPRYHFVLVANVVESHYMPELKKMCGDRVEFIPDVPNNEAAAITRRAGIYLDTSDQKGHPFGMPISVAESMATGSYVLARRLPEAQAYVDRGGVTYANVEEAASLIRATETWDDARWGAAWDAAIVRGRAFSADAVLPKMLADWSEIVRG